MADTMREKLEVIAHLGDHITYKEDIGIFYDSALAKVIEDAYMELKNGVKVQEHGEWIDKGWDGDFSWRIDGRGNCWHVYECSNCKNELCGIPKTNYCPACGSKMI